MTTDHIANRQKILDQLRLELVGPWEHWDSGRRLTPDGADLDLSQLPIRFETKEESYGPWVEAENGEEILVRDPPTRRYGVGVLYPLRTDASIEAGDLSPDHGAQEPEAEDAAILKASAQDDLDTIQERTRLGSEDETEMIDLRSANDYRPATMAVSFLADLEHADGVLVEFRAGRYRPITVVVAGAERTWWRRVPVKLSARLIASDLLQGRGRVVAAISGEDGESEAAPVRIEAFTRPDPAIPSRSLITISIVNDLSRSSASLDEVCLFQSRCRVAVHAGGNAMSSILPYPRSDATSDNLDPEAASFDLLYRDAETFATGHGCAADWVASENRAKAVLGEPMPEVETPSITPDVSDDVGPITVPMAPLAGFVDGDDGFQSLERVVESYASWIVDRRQDAESLPPQYQHAAFSHLADCEVALERMRGGLGALREDPQILQAFRLANQAILQQQLRSRPSRKTFVNGARWQIEGSTAPPDWKTARNRGSWRAFQVAFMLASLRSVAYSDDSDREAVELIWFPTGGGKTEAYLGLSAFALFLRRLRDPADVGVEVIMRYTLRLLTQQQFQRASGLICAMELIRRESEGSLGAAPFSIGLWLGSASSPNSRQEARRALRELNKNPEEDNPFVLLRCPSCAAELGPRFRDRIKAKPKRATMSVAGYEEHAGTVRFQCPDIDCDFADERGMPIYVIDEDIYDHRPSIVVGTVDKFAALAWKPECRQLFGFAPDGTRVVSPPQTIIQDELHLISGPLGSMVGLYEVLIEDLCTDRRTSVPVPPKIISSTATIRRFEDQVDGLYARSDVRLFPPRGLTAGDSFFARYARDGDGVLLPGRRYVGIHAPGLGSMQTTQVRTFAAMLQAPVELDHPARDPWWTLLVFFNSLRELGTSLSLLQSDIPDYLRVMRNRLGLGPSNLRYLRRVQELTGRLSNQEVPRSIEELEKSAADEVIDVCLASNIIEVGIDIDRLSVMAVVGQPKSTSQYIQVTGRVGRKWAQRPGLVLTLLAPGKPRDRSHYEKFRTYHERLYAQVEPTSVTPFSPPVLERALHAVLCGFVRQAGPSDRPPRPIPEAELRDTYDKLRARVLKVDPEEISSLERVFETRVAEWKRWDRNSWDERSAGGDIPLMRRAGTYASRSVADVSWSVPNSLRNVDAECRAEVTLAYIQGDSDV